MLRSHVSDFMNAWNWKAPSYSTESQLSLVEACTPHHVLGKFEVFGCSCFLPWFNSIHIVFSMVKRHYDSLRRGMRLFNPRKEDN